MHRVRTVSLIDEGRWGEVFVGLDEVLRRRVVVKRLASASFENAETRRRLIEEARILSRLDHPNVLRIHDYSERDGYDVFTFEFAPGTPLPEALETGVDFAKKVRIATAVASALVVAHRNGIVHGALSPSSVIIAENDEIKVADFTSTSTQLDGRRAEAEWQSPEEKRGAEPSRAGDMYAFGLLLREIFGEKDRDIRAITGSLVRDAPSERATAAATLAGLHRLARRPARRIRIAAVILAAAFVLFGGMKYAFDLQRERREALEATAEAEERRRKVHELVAFMIRDLRPKLESVGRVDILDSASAKAMDYFASINPEDISPDEAAVHVAAIVQLGQNQSFRSNLPAALKAYRRAVSLGEAMIRRQPDNVEVRARTANAHAMLSQALDRNGDGAGALLHSRAYATATADLVRREPNNVRFLRDEAYAHSNLGSLHDRREEIAASLREFQTAVAIKRRLLPPKPRDDQRLDLSVTVHKVGMALFKLGRFREAREMLEEEHRSLAAMLARGNRDKRLPELLARCDEHLLMIAFAAGDVEAANRHAAAYLSTSRDLGLFDPGNIDWARHLISAERSSGTAARLRGNVTEALEHHAASIATLAEVTAGNRQTALLLRELGHARAEHARSLLAAGLPSAALAEAQRGVEELSRIREDPPTRRFLGDALLVEGEARAARGDLTAANAAWHEALRILEPFDTLSTDPRVADSHARVLLHLGRVDRAQTLIEQLAAIGYRHRELEALSGEKGAVVPNHNQQKGDNP